MALKGRNVFKLFDSVIINIEDLLNIYYDSNILVGKPLEDLFHNSELFI